MATIAFDSCAILLTIRRTPSLAQDGTIYLGTETVGGAEHVRYWSSNQPAGYGEAVVPKTKVAWAIFSRLERPARASRLAQLPPMDRFLADMLKRSFTREEVAAACGF